MFVGRGAPAGRADVRQRRKHKGPHPACRVLIEFSYCGRYTEGVQGEGEAVTVGGRLAAIDALEREPRLDRDVRSAVERACEHLLARQHPQGWWKGELQTNVTMDAEDMLLREFLGIREPETTARSAAWIRSQQRDDGTWSNFYGGPADLSTTIESYVALRLAGDLPEDPHMR